MEFTNYTKIQSKGTVFPEVDIIWVTNHKIFALMPDGKRWPSRCCYKLKKDGMPDYSTGKWVKAETLKKNTSKV